MIVAAVGLAREARIASGPSIEVVIGACDPNGLRERLKNAAGNGARGIISFGIAGALSPMLRTGDCVIATAVHAGYHPQQTDQAWTAALRGRLPDALPAPILGMDAILPDAHQKRRQFARTGAAAVDTESHIVAEIASEQGLPFAALRVITDTASTNLPPAALKAIGPEGKTRVFSVMGSVMAGPGQIPLLVRTGSDARTAFRALLRCRKLLGPGLGFPDLG